jgi:putative phosphoesterase
MRILLVADIHGNWPALQAVTEPHDLCLCLGDLVDYALDPKPCIDWVQREAFQTVRGNHDHGMAQNVTLSGKNGFKYLSGVTRALARPTLSDEELRFLGRLPLSRMLTIDNTRFLLVHATPRDPLDEYAAADPEFWRRRLLNVEADVVCVGHTHQPYVLEVGDKLVINPGSVGQPRDGDPRASYAVIEDYKVELKRVEYAVEDTVQSVLESALPEQAKELLAEIFRTGSSKNGNNKEDKTYKPEVGKSNSDDGNPPQTGALAF